jgi:hypothetical protein
VTSARATACPRSPSRLMRQSASKQAIATVERAWVYLFPARLFGESLCFITVSRAEF